MSLISIYSKNKVFFLYLFIVLFFVVSLLWYNAILALATALILSVAGIFLLNWIDDKVMSKVDTFKEIVTKENIAYAILLLSYSIVIASGIIAGAAIFFTLK